MWSKRGHSWGSVGAKTQIGNPARPRATVSPRATFFGQDGMPTTVEDARHDFGEVESMTDATDGLKYI
jgi:hypothetical protein